MADKKLNEVPVVSDIVTIFGKRSNGEIVQIDKSNLATLLEELLGINDTWYRKRSDSITDFNEANKTGYILLQNVQSMDNKPNTPSNYGYLDTIFVKDGYIRQTYTDLQSRFFIRICNNGTWTDWKQIQTT